MAPPPARGGTRSREGTPKRRKSLDPQGWLEPPRGIKQHQAVHCLFALKKRCSTPHHGDVYSRKTSKGQMRDDGPGASHGSSGRIAFRSAAWVAHPTALSEHKSIEILETFCNCCIDVHRHPGPKTLLASTHGHAWSAPHQKGSLKPKKSTSSKHSKMASRWPPPPPSPSSTGFNAACRALAQGAGAAIPMVPMRSEESGQGPWGEMNGGGVR